VSESRYVITEASGRPFMGLGALVTRLVHPSTVGSDRLGVSLARMEPGDRIKLHRHAYEEAYFVIEGEGIMQLEGEDDIALVPGVAVYVPPNLIHGQVNTSSGPLRILCSLSPPPIEGEVPELME
jgi:quercetin dioxygenase-like cupin family protein